MEIKTYEEFKQLSQDEQNFHIYSCLLDVPKYSDLDCRYSAKWVEKWFIKVIATISMAVLMALIALIIK